MSRTIHQTFGIGAALIACVVGSAIAQEAWPTHGDVLDRGEYLGAGELAGLMEGSTAIIVLELEGPVFGRIFSCEGESSRLFEFIPPATRHNPATSSNVPCEIIGSTICFEPEGDWSHCIAVRRLPGRTLLFAGFTDEDLPGLRRVPAQVLGIIPTDARGLAPPIGRVDFGPIAMTLPAEDGFALHEGQGSPLGLVFREEPSGFVVRTVVVGWPDPMAQRPAQRTVEPGDHDRAETELEEWVEDYRYAGHEKNFWGTGRHVQLYEATRLDFATGRCVRIRWHVSSSPEHAGTDREKLETAFLEQVCITPPGGAMLLVSTTIEGPLDAEDLAVYESKSREILDSIRLGFGSED